jgi:hypothetical protein
MFDLLEKNYAEQIFWILLHEVKPDKSGINNERLVIQRNFLLNFYSEFHQFRPAKFADGDSILSSIQFLLLAQQPLKIKLTIKVVKIESKIIISVP